MKVRQLEQGDLASLSEFIIDAYNDYPLATWFKEEPDSGQIERIFYNKMRGIGSRELIDIVTEDRGTIAGECEIAKIDFDRGVIGILVRHGYRKRSIGSGMLRLAMESAVDVGISKFIAEVADENKEAIKFFMNHSFIPIGYRDIERQEATHKIMILQHSI